MATGSPAKPSRPPIGNYEILAHVATGGMGAVYKALDARLGREVALKILLPDQAAQKPLLLKRFRLEARYGGQLSHENIVTLYEYGEIHGIHFLALEYVDGVSLHDYIAQKGTLEVQESRQIIIQAVRAIGHLRKHGIIHRDIKPSNFLVTQRKGLPFIKLIDLGLARRVDDSGPRVTLAGTTLGTVDYLAPEQARDSGAADVRSDIYSLGCTWYHMLAGRPPFAEGTVAERVHKHVSMPPPDLLKINPRVPDSVNHIVLKMLAKNPAERYQTPEELLDALEAKSADESASEMEIEQAGGAEPAAPTASQVDLLADLAGEHGAGAAARKRRAGRTEFLDYERRQENARLLPKSEHRQQERRFWAIGAGVVSAVVLCASAVLYLQPSPKQSLIGAAPDDAAAQTEPRARGAVDPLTRSEPPPVNPEPAPELVKPPTRPTPEPPSVSNADAGKEPASVSPPPLYKREKAIDTAALREEFERPWKAAAPSSPPPAVHLVRKTQVGGQPRFESLAAALAATVNDRETIIEIDDDGPYFTTALAFERRNVTLRSGKGCRPLIVWDLRGQAADKADRLLTASRGNLRLENVDVGVRTADAKQPETFALFQVTEGDFRAEGCTFSIAGQHAKGVAVVRLGGTRAMGSRRCRLDRCYVRGSEAVLLESRSGAEVLVSDCLVAGGADPCLTSPLLQERRQQPYEHCGPPSSETERFCRSDPRCRPAPPSHSAGSDGTRWSGAGASSLPEIWSFFWIKRCRGISSGSR